MSVLVGKAAPDFNAVTVMGNNEINENFNLKKHLNGKYDVIFSIHWTLPLFAPLS